MDRWLAWFAVTLIIVGAIMVIVGWREWRLWKKENPA